MILVQSKRNMSLHRAPWNIRGRTWVGFGKGPFQRVYHAHPLRQRHEQEFWARKSRIIMIPCHDSAPKFTPDQELGIRCGYRMPAPPPPPPEIGPACLPPLYLSRSFLWGLEVAAHARCRSNSREIQTRELRREAFYLQLELVLLTVKKLLCLQSLKALTRRTFPL